MDVFDKEKRSEIMSHVKGKNTAPEMRVRTLLHALGYRYRLHNRSLPGNPDIVLRKHDAVIFVHGCFWHGHKGCSRSRRPQTRREFWDHKLDETIQRDEKNITALHSLGWRVHLIWECETRNRMSLKDRLDFILRLGELSK